MQNISNIIAYSDSSCKTALQNYSRHSTKPNGCGDIHIWKIRMRRKYWNAHYYQLGNSQNLTITSHQGYHGSTGHSEPCFLIGQNSTKLNLNHVSSLVRHLPPKTQKQHIHASCHQFFLKFTKVSPIHEGVTSLWQKHVKETRYLWILHSHWSGTDTTIQPQSRHVNSEPCLFIGQNPTITPQNHFLALKIGYDVILLWTVLVYLLWTELYFLCTTSTNPSIVNPSRAPWWDIKFSSLTKFLL